MACAVSQQWRSAPDSLVAPPQIHKLADRSGVISEVPKCSKIQIFRGTTPDSAEALTRPSSLWEGSLSPPKTPTPALDPSGLVSTGLGV